MQGVLGHPLLLPVLGVCVFPKNGIEDIGRANGGLDALDGRPKPAAKRHSFFWVLVIRRGDKLLLNKQLIVGRDFHRAICQLTNGTLAS